MLDFFATKRINPEFESQRLTTTVSCKTVTLLRFCNFFLSPHAEKSFLGGRGFVLTFKYLPGYRTNFFISSAKILQRVASVHLISTFTVLSRTFTNARICAPFADFAASVAVDESPESFSTFPAFKKEEIREIMVFSETLDFTASFTVADDHANELNSLLI